MEFYDKAVNSNRSNIIGETMNLSRLLSLILILVGGFIAFYAQAGANQNQYILVAGIFILMMGVYRISRNIPSKHDRGNTEDNGDGF